MSLHPARIVDSLWEDMRGSGQRIFVSSHLMIDSVWEDMNDDGHRIFCWLPDPWLTHCGKTGVATAKSKLLVTCVEFAQLGRSATGLVSILITEKIWHSCGKLHCIVSPHVALTASSIFAFCPFAARYFCTLSNCRLRCRSLPKNQFIFCAAP